MDYSVIHCEDTDSYQKGTRQHENVKSIFFQLSFGFSVFDISVQTNAYPGTDTTGEKQIFCESIRYSQFTHCVYAECPRSVNKCARYPATCEKQYPCDEYV